MIARVDLTLIQKMTTFRKFLWVSIAIYVAGTFVRFNWFMKESVGYSGEANNGMVHVSAGTTPLNVLVSLLGVALFCMLMRMEVRVVDFKIAPLWRRFAAFLTDFWFFLSVPTSIAALAPLLFERIRTGTFKWHFEREYFVASDAVSTVLIIGFLAAMVLYFAGTLAARRQTVGCFLFRVATVSAGGDVLRLPLSTALWRTYHEFSGLCSPLRTIKERDRDGRTWYDRETGFTVVSC